MRFAILAALAFSAMAQTKEDKEKYADFADDMDHWGFTWEPIKVQTDDGWTLTTFHITGKTGEEPVDRDEDLNPVLMMHGQGCDATTWVWPDPSLVNLPLPLHLFDSGFDIYMASNRGTKYCQEHATLKPSEPEFWAFSWAEMGLYDDVANIKMVRDRTDKKVSYVGVSQGTVQMFYALSKLEESFLKDNLYTFAALDPCTIQSDEGERIYREGLFHFEDYGVYVLGGPNWQEDEKTICDNFDEEICEYARGYAGGEPVTVQTNLHWAQNVLENRFQEFAPNYTKGETETPLIDLTTVKHVPVTVWSGYLDDVCYNAQAKIIVSDIGERVTYFRTVPWADHGYWGGPLTSGLYEELKQRLINPEMRPYPLVSDPADFSTN